LYWSAKNRRPGSSSINTDACVPISALPELIKATSEDFKAAGVVGNYNKRLVDTTRSGF